MVTTSGIDNEHVRQLARKSVQAGVTNAPEIGRTVASELAAEFQGGDPNAWANLVGLAALGAAYYGRSVLKENRLKVRRRGKVTTISGGYALPTGVAMSAPSAAIADEDAELAESTYVQFEMLTWASFHAVLQQLQGRRDALDGTIVTFEEISKLEDLYPDCLVGEAIARAGLDLTGREIDLDSLDIAI